MPRKPQPGLFDGGDLQQDRAGEESQTLYDLVKALRRRGHTVTRAGADHVVDGRKLSTREFMDHAAALLAQPERPAGNVS